MAADYGAHEIMQLNEVLTDLVDAINQFELYRPYVTDQELSIMLDKQMGFMTMEYNDTVQALNQRGIPNPRPYKTNINSTPQYGLDNPLTQSPNTSAQRMDNRDVASGMLGCLKSSAILKSMACLECADLSLRRMVQQGAINCSEMAYEVWQYMNQKGYYQVPTLKQMTTDTIISTHVPANMKNMSTMSNVGNMNNINNMNNTNLGQYNMASNITSSFGNTTNFAEGNYYNNTSNAGNTIDFSKYNNLSNFMSNSNQNLNAGGSILQ